MTVHIKNDMITSSSLLRRVGIFITKPGMAIPRMGKENIMSQGIQLMRREVKIFVCTICALIDKDVRSLMKEESYSREFITAKKAPWALEIHTLQRWSLLYDSTILYQKTSSESTYIECPDPSVEDVHSDLQALIEGLIERFPMLSGRLDLIHKAATAK